MRPFLVFLGFLLAVPAFASDGNTISIGDAAEHALQQSRLTLPGSKPFHLLAVIREINEPNSDYQAKIEEYWVSPQKWKRTIESPEFSQILVVNGDSVFEKNTGDYFPFWLNSFVVAIMDPLPMLDALKQSGARLAKPQRSEKSISCSDLHATVDRWVICFEGSHGLLTSVFTKGYSAEFKDFKKFGEKLVARRITNDPEPGTSLEARITDLTELAQPYEQIFVVPEHTPPPERIQRLRIDEDAFRKLSLDGTEIDWPPVGDGLTTGGCAVYASSDRAGHVREVWPAGCDNASLQTSLRDAVRKWRLEPAISEGVPVQVEALLGFTFHTTANNSLALPELLNAQVRNLVTNAVEPIFPPGSLTEGTEVIVQVSIDETGKLVGVGNTHKLAGPVFFAIYAALQKWQFSPYIQDGKPQYFRADVIFHVQ